MENKKNSSITSYILYAVSILCSLVGILIYRFLPVSKLANSIEHSGMDAVYALITSPVLAFFALVLFVLSFGMIIKKFSAGPVKNIIVGASGVTAAGLIFNFIAALLFLLKQNKLGFVAPIYDTVWETLLSVMAFVLVFKFILFVFEILADKGIIKK